MKFVYSYFDGNLLTTHYSRLIAYLNKNTDAYAIVKKDEIFHLIFLKMNMKRKCDAIRFLYRKLPTRPFTQELSSTTSLSTLFAVPIDKKNYEELFDVAIQVNAACSDLLSTEMKQYNDIDYWASVLTKTNPPNIKELYVEYKAHLLQMNCPLPNSEVVLKNTFQQILNAMHISVEPLLKLEADNLYAQNVFCRYDDIAFWSKHLATVVSPKYLNSENIHIIYKNYKLNLLANNCDFPPTEYLLKCAFQKILLALKIDFEFLLDAEYAAMFKQSYI